MTRWLTCGLALAVSALAGCPDNPGAGCPEDCARGYQCDVLARTCVPTALPIYERPLPGRAVRIAAQAGRLWTAAIDPSDGAIVVTEIIQGREREARVLATPTLALDRRLAMDASSRLLAVAWLASSGSYELGWRTLPGDHAMWNFTTIAAPPGDGYAGTHDFDLAVTSDHALALVFRDRNRTTRALLADAPDGEWTLELVDDGGTTDDGVTCPDQLRRVQPAAGVGYDVDAAARGTQLFAAYYDADCGDLRLARRGDQRWSRAVVDTGDSSTQSAERGLAGRFPSIAFDAAGTVALAYHDMSGGRLMFAAERDGRFETEVVDPGFEIDAFSRERKNIVGAFANLTLDSNGGAAVVYFDATSADLQFARRNSVGAEWSRSTLVASGAVGFSADQVVQEDVGRFVVAERMVPAGNGFESELVFVEAGQ